MPAIIFVFAILSFFESFFYEFSTQVSIWANTRFNMLTVSHLAELPISNSGSIGLFADDIIGNHSIVMMTC